MPNNPTRRDFLRYAAVFTPALLLGGAGLGFGGTELYDQAIKPTRIFTDDLGRDVEIPTPSHLKRVYFSGPTGQIMLFSLKPELIAGTTLLFTQEELAYLPAGTGDLPFMGSCAETAGELDIASLQEADIQLVLSTSSDDGSIGALSDPDAFQRESGIPVVHLDAGFDSMGDAFRELGDIVGARTRAEEVASYCEDIYESVTRAISAIPAEARTHLYYAEGSDGLETESFTSAHAYTFGVAGAYNIAEVNDLSIHGMAHVSIEQVHEWNPEIIIAWSQAIRGGADQLIRTSERWRGIAAVDTGRVYTMPNVPFSWCDRPAGPNRCIGIQWVANLLYPDYYDVDMLEVTKDFYRTMWRIQVTDDQVREILGNSYRG